MTKKKTTEPFAETLGAVHDQPLSPQDIVDRESKTWQCSEPPAQLGRRNCDGPPPIPAGLLIRLVASAIDTLVIQLPVWIVAILTGIILSSKMALDDAVDMINMLVVASGAIYNAALLSSAWQATLGQRLLGLYVASAATRQRLSVPITICRYLTVNLAGVLGTLLLLTRTYVNREAIWQAELAYWTVIAMSISLSRNKRGLHDVICQTCVLRGRL